MARKPRSKRQSRPATQTAEQTSVANGNGASPTTDEQKAKLIAQQQFFEGPIPPPVILEGYEQICPGAADRILKMAESVTDHVNKLERDAVEAKHKEVARGQRFGFSIGALALVSSVACAYIGEGTTASIIGGTTVVGLVSVFVVGKITKK